MPRARTFLYRLLGALAVVWCASAFAAERKVMLLTIEGGIGPAVSEYIKTGLEAARQRDDAAVILQIDTPGGLVSATREIVQAILASPVPVFAYVAPAGARAASAGTYIVYASQLAAMAPGSNIGAATPVRIGGAPDPSPTPTDRKDDKPQAQGAMERKIVNDAVAWIRGLADLQGRNADWAEKAVREGASLPARDAAELGVVNFIAGDARALLRQAQGKSFTVLGERREWNSPSADIEPFEPDWRLRILAAITDPNIAYILLLIGVYGLLFEALAPGSLFPGAIGALALLVGLYAMNLLPVNAAGALLLALGAGLMIAEAITPTLGVLGFAGVAAFVVGSVFLFRGDVPAFSLSPWVIFAAAATSGAIVIWVAAAGLRAWRRPVSTGDAEFTGARVRVVSWAGETGFVQHHGELWGARGPAQISAGDWARVVSRNGLTLVIAPEDPVTSIGDKDAV